MANLIQYYSGLGRVSNLEASVSYIFDSSIGESGAYRPTNSTDFAGGGGSSSSRVGISGGFVGLTGTVNTTGNVTIAPNSRIGVTGIQLPITNLTSGTSGSPAPLTFNQENGALITQIPNLDRTSDTVVAYGPGIYSVTGFGPRTGIGTVINAQFRNIVYVQNLQVNPLVLAFTGTASATNYHMVLKADTATGAGNGGIWSSDSYYGQISITGTSPYYIAWEG